MADLKIFASIIEDEAKKQINTLLAQPAFADCKVRIMPDVHAGAGCVIGFTADLGDKVIPNIVGVDIGCGMYTVKICDDVTKADLEKLDQIIRESIPSGFSVYEQPKDFFLMLDELKCRENIEKMDRIKCSLGTLGGGNHFIEVDRNESGDHFLLIHSGSRNLGKQVADIYQNIAIDMCSHKEEKAKARRAIVDGLKLAGYPQDINKTIIAMEKQWETIWPTVPKELSYLTGRSRGDYLYDMWICQCFAVRNREVMACRIFEAMGWDAGESFHTVHNYIDNNNMVRKGAVSAKAGEKLLIPINMRDGSLLCIGKGNSDWNYSAPHGAGRIMSRAAAKNNLTVDSFRKTMDGIYTTSVSEATLDEAPEAYKPLDAILPLLSETVEVVDRLYPVYNFKASEA